MKFESGRYRGRSSQEKGVSTPHQWTRRVQQTRYWLKSFSAWTLSVSGSSVTFQSVLEYGPFSRMGQSPNLKGTPSILKVRAPSLYF